MAVLSHNQVNEVIWEVNKDNHILKAEYKCPLCGSEIWIHHHGFATAVVNKCKLPMCPICGEETRCVTYEVENE